MKNNIKFLGLTMFIALLAFSTYSCEEEENPIGASVLTRLGAHNETLFIDVNTNTMPPEAIRSDKSRIEMLLAPNIYSDKATVGVYNEPIFGKTNSSFYSQIRLGELNPDFGKNAIVDSVVLSLPSVSFFKDTIKKSEKLIETLYSTNKDENCKYEVITNIYEKNYTMQIDSIYGDISSRINLQVHRVTESMGTIEDSLFSNKGFNTGELLGEKTVSNLAPIRVIVSSSKKGEKEETQVINKEGTPNYHIQLKGLVKIFQDNVINNFTNTGDQVTFINNVLQGIKISTNSENGFIFTFEPSKAKLIMYYSFDNPDFKDTNKNGVDDSEEDCPNKVIKSRKTGTYQFLMGEKIGGNIGGYNVFQNEINNSGANISPSTNKIYLSGMGGNTVLLDFDKEQIQKLKENVQNKHWAITEASLKVYPDLESQGNLPIPQYLHVYNHTDKKIIEDYLGERTNGKEGLFFYRISEPYNKKYYHLRITDFIKNIVEKDVPLTSLSLVMGNYINPNEAIFYTPMAYDFSNNIYNPFRLVAFGGNNNTPKKLKLEIQYTVR